MEPGALTTVAVAFAASWALSAAHCARAADLKTLAIMLPEEPTDFGWNQQAFDAAKIVAAKYHLNFMPAAGLGSSERMSIPRPTVASRNRVQPIA